MGTRRARASRKLATVGRHWWTRGFPPPCVCTTVPYITHDCKWLKRKLGLRVVEFCGPCESSGFPFLAIFCCSSFICFVTSKMKHNISFIFLWHGQDGNPKPARHLASVPPLSNAPRLDWSTVSSASSNVLGFVSDVSSVKREQICTGHVKPVNVSSWWKGKGKDSGHCWVERRQLYSAKLHPSPPEPSLGSSVSSTVEWATFTSS